MSVALAGSARLALPAARIGRPSYHRRVTSDPFPRERLSATLHRMPAYARLAFGLAGDPALAKKRRAAVIAAAGYLISPIDLVPGVIPVLGQLDDLAVAVAALRFALAGLDTARRREHLAAVGLADDDLAHDLATMGAVTAWTVRAGARTTRRAAVKGGQVAAWGARAAGDAAMAGAARVSPHLRDAAVPIVRRAAAATPGAVKAAGARAARGASLARRGAPRVRVSVPGRRTLPAPAAQMLSTEPDLLDGRDDPH